MADIESGTTEVFIQNVWSDPELGVTEVYVNLVVAPAAADHIGWGVPI